MCYCAVLLLAVVVVVVVHLGNLCCCFYLKIGILMVGFSFFVVHKIFFCFWIGLSLWGALCNNIRWVYLDSTQDSTWKEKESSSNWWSPERSCISAARIVGKFCWIRVQHGIWESLFHIGRSGIWCWLSFIKFHFFFRVLLVIDAFNKVLCLLLTFFFVFFFLFFGFCSLHVDVWMGNSRGNRYSTNNTHLKPSQHEFWVRRGSLFVYFFNKI